MKKLLKKYKQIDIFYLSLNSGEGMTLNIFQPLDITIEFLSLFWCSEKDMVLFLLIILPWIFIIFLLLFLL